MRRPGKTAAVSVGPFKEKPDVVNNLKSSTSSTRYLGFTYMLLLAVQYGFQPFLTSTFTPPITNKISIVLGQELVKAAYSIPVLMLSGSLGKFFAPSQFFKNLYCAALPAGIYSVQNWCTQIAAQSLDGVTFTCLNQTKLVSTALCVYLLLGKKQSLSQIGALLMLVGAALLLQSGTASTASNAQTPTNGSLMSAGVMAILAASMLSGIAAALCQRNVQRMGAMELTFAMSLVSLVMLTFSLAVESHSPSALSMMEQLAGIERGVAIPILTNAAGGILVGQVTHHMGGVSKGFSVVGGLIVSGVVQSYVNNTILPPTIFVALMMVCLATGLHACSPHKEKIKPS